MKVLGVGLGLALLVSACKGSSDEPPAGQTSDSGEFSYCGDYRGPKPGTILNQGTRSDECEFDREKYASLANKGEAQGANELLTETIGNACHWRVVLAEDDRVLDEGDCRSAVANEASGGLLLMLSQSEGNPGGDQYRNFGFNLAAGTRIVGEQGKISDVEDPVLWCDVKNGVEMTLDDSSQELSGPVTMTASYTHRMPAEDGQPNIANLGVVTSFSCNAELGVNAVGANVDAVTVNIDSVERQCWFTNSFVYRVTGSATADCTGTLDGDVDTKVAARLEVEF